MSSAIWTHQEVSSNATAWKGVAYRIVEFQHVASTMKLVDSLDEQDVLESLLESSKPKQPENVESLHYLLSTPFRYDPKREGSRFRSATDPGVFYGAESFKTAGAELGYWRWKFLKDADDVERLEPVAHTGFKVEINTKVVDLRSPPFNAHADKWKHPNDYGLSQSFARTVRESDAGAIVYESIRDTEKGWCIALLDPTGFAGTNPSTQTQTWYMTISKNIVTLRSETGAMMFNTGHWGTR